MTNYSGAIAQLLTYGGDLPFQVSDWKDYTALGITSADIPELIQMATDATFYEADDETPEGWAHVHAWRALAQLKAEDAVEPLLQAYERFGESEGWWQWFTEELPAIFLMLGEAAIPKLRHYLSRRSRSKEAGFAEFTAIEGLERIAKANSDLKPQCIEICLEELRYASKHQPDVNGYLAGVLASFKVTEAASLIEQAFAGGFVDPSISGDWDDIQVRMGLKSRAEVRKQMPFGATKRSRDRFVEPARGYRSPSQSTEFKGFSSSLSKPKSESQQKHRKKKK
jgi:hypothetical protein